MGKQYYRLRNFGENTGAFSVSFSHINDELKRACPPSGEGGIEFSEPPKVGELNGVCNKLEKIKRYQDDRITVSNFGDELDYFRDDGDMIERFEM